MADFWIVLGSNYDVVIFRTLAEAKAFVEADVFAPSYFGIFEGSFGQEFSGWIGTQRRLEKDLSSG